MGLHVGLTEMGLVRSVTAERIAEGWNVQLHLRLTSPGCQYFFYFQQELEARLLEHPDIAVAAVHWDERLDWTPADLAPSAREKVAARQARLRPLPMAKVGTSMADGEKQSTSRRPVPARSAMTS